MAARQAVAPPPAADAAAAEIANLGFSYKLDEGYDLTQVSLDRRIQVRNVKSYIPKQMVERFAAQMRGGAVFPPIVVTADGWLVDGNTRYAARVKRREMLHPAYVLDVSWEDADAHTQHMLFALAATLNSHGGKQLDADEQRAAARQLIELGWRNEQVARTIGVPVAKLATIKRQLQAEKRMREIGVDPAAVKTKLNVLGDTAALALNGDPYKAVVDLAADANLSQPEIKVLVRAAKDTGSDTKALELLSQQRETFAGRITEHRLTGKGKPSGANMLLQHLGFITKYQGREKELRQTNPDAVESFKEQLSRAITVLERVRALS